MKHGDIVLVKNEFGDPKKAEVNWIKDENVGISYIGKGNLGTSNVVKASILTVVKESRGFRYNDIVKTSEGEARVNWAENGNVGITYLSPPNIKGAVSVELEQKITLISASAKDEMAERIASISDEDLEKRIQEIRGRRYPKAPTTYRRLTTPKVEREKKISMDNIFKLMDDNPKT